MDPQEGQLILNKLLSFKEQKREAKEKQKQLFHFFNLLIEHLTAASKIPFTTLFARIAYLGTQKVLNPKLLYQIHSYRRAQEADITYDNQSYKNAISIIATLIGSIYNIPVPNEESKMYKKQKSDFKISNKYKAYLKGVLTTIDREQKVFEFIEDGEDNKIKKVKYDVTGKNEQFTKSIEKIPRLYKLPLHINLIDANIDDCGFLIPNSFVIDPNYLIDATAIAELSKPDGMASSLLYLMKKFLPFQFSKGLLMGNVANFLLDELITSEHKDKKDLLQDIFHLNAIGFASQSDDFVKEVLQDINLHYHNLLNVVENKFEALQIDTQKIYLEPSFLVPQYGIQGRLDVLHLDEENAKADIVELKSGSVFMPNVYGLNSNHYTQTLLYDLMVQSSYNKKYKATNYILYSKQNQNSLRFAPTIKSQQIAALEIRNHIVLLEKSIEDPKDLANLLSLIKTNNFPKAKGFVKKNIAQFQKVYESLSLLEQEYFVQYGSMICREHRLSKSGKHGIMSNNGLATIWLSNLDQKEQHFAILRKLKINKNKSQNKDATITLLRSKHTNPLANFRKGDIAILYPNEKEKTVISNQIFKCTIIQIDKQSVQVKLRSKQTNQRIFRFNEYWNIEPDHLDSSVNTLYKSMFSFATAPKKYKELILGLRPPEFKKLEQKVQNQALTTEQNQILNEMIGAVEYYLLWGPPGTGKTSVMLKEYVKYLLEHQEEKILLLAYTNRAVDEICESISKLNHPSCQNFIRIGSRYSCDENFKKHLLSTQIKQLKSRNEVLNFLHSTNIYVGTISSLNSQSGLFNILDFGTVIIDEASQILDPLLAGILPKFKKFVLIGDHQQLPAVVVQENELTKIREETLLDIGLNDLRDSLFERLYKRCRNKSWDYAVGILSNQGRMHEELMTFPNLAFYDKQLKTISFIPRLKEKSFLKDPEVNTLSKIFTSGRRFFVSTPIDDDFNLKSNVHEADAIVQILKLYDQIFCANKGKVFNIGVITPFRAQIAQINQQIQQSNLDIKNLSIDTVERYQGSAKDIIIISFCANANTQLKSISSLSSEGIDRKLNVALTRAKEQIILIGNEDVMRKNPLYSDLIDSYTKVIL